MNQYGEKDYNDKIRDLFESMMGKANEEFAALQNDFMDMCEYYDKDVMTATNTDLDTPAHRERYRKALDAILQVNRICEQYHNKPMFAIEYSMYPSLMRADVDNCCAEFVTEIYGNDKQKEVFYGGNLAFIYTITARMARADNEKRDEGNIYSMAWRALENPHKKSDLSLDELIDDCKGETAKREFAKKIADLSAAFTFHPQNEDVDYDKVERDLETIPAYFDAMIRQKGLIATDEFIKAGNRCFNAVKEINEICERYGKEKMFNGSEIEWQCFDFCRGFYMNDRQKEVFHNINDLWEITESVEKKSLHDVIDEAIRKGPGGKDVSLDEMLTLLNKDDRYNPPIRNEPKRKNNQEVENDER